MRRLFADKNGAEYVRNMLSQETMRCNGNWSIRDPIGLAVRETSEVELLREASVARDLRGRIIGFIGGIRN